jgi:hydrogenase maturation protein HypF
MELESALSDIGHDEWYRFELSGRPDDSSPLIVDWAPVVGEILRDLELGIDGGVISARFHNALAEAIVAVARYCGEERVVLSGGCFQNRYLTQQAVTRLQAAGIRVYWHQRVPPNDGGIALGQIVAAQRALRSSESAPQTAIANGLAVLTTNR